MRATFYIKPLLFSRNYIFLTKIDFCDIISSHLMNLPIKNYEAKIT